MTGAWALVSVLNIETVPLSLRTGAWNGEWRVAAHGAWIDLESDFDPVNGIRLGLTWKK